MPLTLTVLQGPAAGTQVTLESDPSPRTVGRSPVADLCIPDEWLAERHFAVYFDGIRAILRDLGTPCVVHQPKYSLFERTPEAGLLDVVEKEGLGCAIFSPLAQGLLTDRYLQGIPADARAGKPHGFLRPEQIEIGRAHV